MCTFLCGFVLRFPCLYISDTTTEVSVNRTETQYIISDLDPYTNYTVWMVAESRQGRGAMSQGQTHPTRMSSMLPRPHVNHVESRLTAMK